MLFLVLFSALNLCGQTKEAAIARVSYRFTHYRDTIDISKMTENDMILLLGPSLSGFKSRTRMVHDSIMLANMRKMKGGPVGSTVPVGVGTQIYLDHKNKKAHQMDVLIKNYYYPITYPIIDWTIYPDTMTISGLKCQKARGEWKGRIYDAWFCPDIPFKAGPWKLNGLPGLIISAVDQKKQVKFEFTGFEKLKNGTVFIELPKDRIVTTEANYKKMQNAFLDDPISYMKALMPEIKSIVPPNKYVRKPPINNPLELLN
ncbi:GLPGLI family protein [Chryseobacterium sp. G0201]|uniref:GLPGLI family protein n=1 Tax=Chryseobacterium sp. G0201 TaxID=2487065 RepID=UPI001E5B4189|nr:GLPGLI family protein [Chryseobacterium sp. G0201]